MPPDFAVTTPMRATESNTRPSFVVPANSCDSHFHVFEEGYPPVGDPQYTFPEARLEQYVNSPNSWASSGWFWFSRPTTGTTTV